MRKQGIFLIIVLVMALALMACGKKQENTENNKEDITKNESEDNKKTGENDNSKEEKTALLSGTYQVPLENVYIDTPAFNMIESSYSRLFMVNDVKYVAFTCLYEEIGTNAKSALDTTFEDLKENLFGYHQVNFLNDVEEKSIEVNGIDTYCIKGTVNCGTENIYDAYVYGYSFVFEGYPCSIIGVVEDQAQKQEDIDNITEVVDAMMKSVRNEK